MNAGLLCVTYEWGTRSSVLLALLVLLAYYYVHVLAFGNMGICRLHSMAVTQAENDPYFGEFVWCES